MPFTSTEVNSSRSVPDTVTCALLVSTPSMGDATPTEGRTVSRFTGTRMVCSLPALSSTSSLIRLAPSTNGKLCQAKSSKLTSVATSLIHKPTRFVSFTAPLTVMSGVLTQESGGGEVRVISGGTVSRFTLTSAVVSLAALSLASTVTTLRPSTSWNCPRAKFFPDTAAAISLTITVVLTSSTLPDTSIWGALTKAPSAGEAMEITGGKVSRMTVMLSVAMLPAGSTAVAAMLLLPSAREKPARLKLRPLT